MAILEYQLRVVGEADIARALASTEARFVRHQRVINQTFGATATRRSPRSPAQVTQAAARSSKAVLTAEQHRVRVQATFDQKYEIAAHRQKLKNIEARKREEIAALRATNREAERANQRARQSFARGIGAGASNGVRALASVGKAGIATLGVGGSVLAASAVSEALKLDEQVRRLSVAGRGSGEAGMNPDALRRQFVQTGIATGIAPEQVASGVAAYVAKTGDIKTALANQRTYATVAQASGADVSEVFGAAADLASKMDVKSVQDMADAFAILSEQGKKGAFEFKAMAAEFPEVFSSAANAGAKGLSGVRDVGAVMQLAMKATGNSSEAGTSVNAMFRQLASKSKDMQSGAAFGGRGVQVFEHGDPTKPMRNFVDVVSDSISAARGNIGQLNEVFDARGVKAINPAIKAYREAYNATKGTSADKDKAGRAAVKSTFSEFRDVNANFKEVERDAGDVMKSASIQFEVATEQLKQSISEELLPVMRDLAPAVKEFAPPLREVTKGLISLGGAVLEHPFLGLGAILATSVAAEVAKAQLASVIQQSMTPAFMAASGGALKFAGAAGLAAVAVYAAYDQNESLKKETGGKGILDVGWEWATTDKGLKEIADENLDRQAKAEAAARGWMGSGSSATAYAPGAVGPDGVVMSPAAPPVPAARGGGSLDATAASAKGVASELDALRASVKAANAELAKVRGDALNRGNSPSSPSPVKG